MKRLAFLRWAPVACPVLIVLLVYLTWFLAYTELGHMPRPSMDDPKHVGGVASTFYSWAVPAILALLGTWAVSTLVVLVAATFAHDATRRNWLTPGAIGALAAPALIFLIRFSPGRALEWFLD